MAFLEISNFRKSFGLLHVLKGVNLELEKGKVMAIIGSSGSGKTTLLRCINFLETPDEGQMVINGDVVIDNKRTDYPLSYYMKLMKKELKQQIMLPKKRAKVRDLPEDYPYLNINTYAQKKALIQEILRDYRHELIAEGIKEKVTRKKKTDNATKRKNRLHFGLVFQNFNLFPHINVIGNLTLARMLMNGKKSSENSAKIKEECMQLLERVGLSSKAYSYPCELSGGQQQRVAIARALALNPDVLCFDEPTSALDPELTGEVLKVIRTLKETGATMIVVTHEMAFARDVADEVIFMADGIIEERGTAEQVFGNPKSEKTRKFLMMSLEENLGYN